MKVSRYSDKKKSHINRKKVTAGEEKQNKISIFYWKKSSIKKEVPQVGQMIRNANHNE